MIYNEKLLNTIKSESYVSPKIEKRVTGKKGALNIDIFEDIIGN